MALLKDGVDGLLRGAAVGGDVVGPVPDKRDVRLRIGSVAGLLAGGQEAHVLLRGDVADAVVHDGVGDVGGEEVLERRDTFTVGERVTGKDGLRALWLASSPG